MEYQSTDVFFCDQKKRQVKVSNEYNVGSGKRTVISNCEYSHECFAEGRECKYIHTRPHQYETA